MSRASSNAESSASLLVDPSGSLLVLLSPSVDIAAAADLPSFSVLSSVGVYGAGKFFTDFSKLSSVNRRMGP